MKISTMVVGFVGFCAVLWVLWKALGWALFGGGIDDQGRADKSADEEL
jgi:hypothetical protein